MPKAKKPNWTPKKKTSATAGNFQSVVAFEDKRKVTAYYPPIELQATQDELRNENRERKHRPQKSHSDLLVALSAIWRVSDGLKDMVRAHWNREKQGQLAKGKD